MSTWYGDGAPALRRPRGLAWGLVALRGGALAGWLAVALGLLLVLRLPERALCGARRPLTSALAQGACRGALWLLGVGFRTQGQPMAHPGAVVANHSSWMDIFVLNAAQRVFFVSKDDVARWPGIGFMARAAGTVFIKRDRREAAAQKALFEQRLHLGHRLLFFPEGTSSDGRRVLPFKPTLFAAFFAPELRDTMWVQPVSVIYEAPPGQDARFYGWWGDMPFGGHMLQVLGQLRQGRVTVVYHPPLRVAQQDSRRSLAAQSEAQVAGCLTGALS